MPSRAPSRRLLAQTRSVKTGEELAQAISDKVEDIRITDHLDLTELKLNTASDQARGSRTLPDVLSPTSSIRGDCARGPTNATVQGWDLAEGFPLVDRLTSRQCLIVCDTDCLTLKASPVWMDSLYWRYKRTGRTDSSANEGKERQRPQVITVSELGKLYMSNVTIQGDGQTGRRDATEAIFVPDVSAQVFTEDTLVHSVGGQHTSAMNILGSASFLNSTFQDININNGKKYGVFFVFQRGKLMLRDSKFINNAARFEVGKNKAGLVYLQKEQAPFIRVNPVDVTFGDDLELDDLWLDYEQALKGTFMSEDDNSYRQVRSNFLDFVPEFREKSGGLTTGSIVGVAVAGALALIAICAALVLLRRRRRAAATKYRDLRGGRSVASSELSRDMDRPQRFRPPSCGSGKSPFSSAAFLSRDARARTETLHGLPDTNVSSVHSHLTTDASNQMSSGMGVEMKAPGKNSTIKERMAWVHWQLDQFEDDHLILDRFQSLGPAARRQGGQALVQFARNTLDQCEYALKVFAVPHAYKAEAAMYQDKSMAKFLPRVEVMHDGTDETLVDPSGCMLPPIIIMEKGESLNEWSARAQPDLFMSIAVLANVALRLSEFHAAGYVHRDIKPANVMWLPRENRWTVIDFGCAGKTGETVPLSFTLVYAAPEAICALKDGEKSIKADPALDAWALGVMAFELLSGKPAFHVLSDGKEEVIAQLTGEKRLPWEQQGAAAAERLEALGVFKGAVLQLLNRDPALRPSMQRFYDAANRIFSSRTTIKI